MVENVVLTVHLILAALLIGVVLLQRSEGGGLGMGGGGGSGVMTGRQAANALSKATWFLAIAFLVTSLGLTIIAARNSSNGSIIDQLDLGGAIGSAPATPLPGIGDYTPPPSAAGQPILPPVSGGVTGTTPAPASTDGSASEGATNDGAVQSPVAPPAAPAPTTPAPAVDTPATPVPVQN